MNSKIVFRLTRALGKRIQYIAGLIDGEGSIGIDLHTKKPSISFLATIRIGMTHRETIERIAKILGTKVSQYTRKRPRRYYDGYNKKIHSRTITIYTVQIYKQADVEELLVELLPYLITKRLQAKLVLEFIKLKRMENRKTLDKQFEIYWKVRRLNPKGKSLQPFDYPKLRKDILETQKKAWKSDKRLSSS